MRISGRTWCCQEENVCLFTVCRMRELHAVELGISLLLLIQLVLSIDWDMPGIDWHLLPVLDLVLGWREGVRWDAELFSNESQYYVSDNSVSCKAIKYSSILDKSPVSSILHQLSHCSVFGIIPPNSNFWAALEWTSLNAHYRLACTGILLLWTYEDRMFGWRSATRMKCDKLRWNEIF